MRKVRATVKVRKTERCEVKREKLCSTRFAGPLFVAAPRERER